MTDPVEQFLATYPTDVQAISRTLRVMVIRAMPEIQEVLYADQNHMGYSFTGKPRDRIVYICPMKNYVRLGFMRGTQLPDPDQMLEGEGKWLRHVKVRALPDASHPALEQLVGAAWAYAKAQMKQ